MPFNIFLLHAIRSVYQPHSAVAGSHGQLAIIIRLGILYLPSNYFSIYLEVNNTHFVV